MLKPSGMAGGGGGTTRCDIARCWRTYPPAQGLPLSFSLTFELTQLSNKGVHHLYLGQGHTLGPSSPSP